MDAQLTIVDVTGSTNDDLLEAGKQGAPHGTGLAARAQTAGRGRRGHKWDSTAGNLLLSIVLRPCVNPAKYSGLAAVSGLAVLEALEKQGLANEIGLKWPNDLVARGRKLGGILVEVCILGRQRHVVIGCGINIAAPPVLPAAAAGQARVTPPAWVQQFAPGVLAPEVLLQVAMPLALAMKQFSVQGFAPWQAEFARRDALAGQLVRLSDGSEGLASGVNAQGGLLIRQVDGQLHEVLSQEVSVRPAGG